MALGVMLCAGMCGIITPAHAQAPVATDAALDAYLAERGLREVQAAALRHRLRTATGATRLELANRLGTIYVELLDAATTPEQRGTIERLAKELLEQVPDAETWDLRLNLAKAQYLFAEDLAERFRLRLTTAEQRAEAERTMRAVNSVFQTIALRSNQRVEGLERIEESARVPDDPHLRAALAEARRVRSLANYYAGWSSYYIGLLTGIGSHGQDAIRAFGWLLNSPGTPARLDRMPESLLTYEHVARAAIGVAMAESLRGQDDNAIRWLEALDRAIDLNDNARRQLVSRRLVILAAGRRWSDLDWHVTRRRRELAAEGQPLLPVGEARLVAVLSLEALRRTDLPERARPMIELIARTAMSDLVNLGEVSHVLNLVQQFGSSQIGTEGFIVNYVRGLQAYEEAKAAHFAGTTDTSEPATDPNLITAFRAAAELLATAIITDDAGHYAAERTNAAIVEGLALFYAGEFEQAAERLGRAHAGATTAAQGEEALWLAVVALDRAAEKQGGASSAEFDRLATLYLQSYPATERAAKLLLRRLSAGLLDDAEAIEILLAVEADSPVHESALRHAARLLYRVYKRSRDEDRQFAAMRFMTVAERVLAMDRRIVSQANRAAALPAAESAVALVRQMLDVALGSATPDLERARASLETLDAIVAQTAIDLKTIDAELAFRRFQIAFIERDTIELDRRLAALHEIGGPFSDAADRMLFNRARANWQASPTDASAAMQVVRHGARVMSRMGDGETALADPAVRALHASVAEAATTIWKARGDVAMRDTALRVDRGLLAAGFATAGVLRRIADAAEDAGHAGESLDAWRTLLAGLTPDSVAWFEARYHSMRLLWKVEPARAAEVATQHRLLHPNFGPEPWGAKIRELHDEILAATRENGERDGEGNEGGGEP